MTRKKAGRQGGAAKQQAKQAEPLPDELYEDADRLYQSDSDPLDAGAEDDDDSEEVEAVMDLEDDEDDSDADLEAGGRLGKGAAPVPWPCVSCSLACSCHDALQGVVCWRVTCLHSQRTVVYMRTCWRVLILQLRGRGWVTSIPSALHARHIGAYVNCLQLLYQGN